MPMWLWVVIGIFIALTIVAALVRAMKPKPFEPVDMEFDMRALKEVKAIDARKEAKARELDRVRNLVNRQNAARENEPPTDPPSPGFFG